MGRSKYFLECFDCKTAPDDVRSGIVVLRELPFGNLIQSKGTVRVRAGLSDRRYVMQALRHKGYPRLLPVMNPL
ncbi:hypothetical protein WJ98_21615 [Burkholderia ubonensis]|nr:hypothetical protein WJ98_21615 [Burkholderia ubonensis]